MIVIPMAGLSSRFFKAGYKKPKYMLEAHGETLFEHSVGSFTKYFSTIRFLFIVKDVFNTPAFVQRKAKGMGIKKFDIVIITDETKGQAETVTLGLEKINVSIDEQVTIFNIDTFRPNFEFPELLDLCDGYLEVFSGSGENWSFVKPLSSESSQVIQTAEKRAISNLCCTGLYHFKSLSSYLEAYYHYLQQPKSDWVKGELYVAPLYNYLINKGLKIHYHLIPKNEVVFCGVPEEYTDFILDK